MLVNAAKYTAEGGRVLVRAEAAEGFVTISGGKGTTLRGMAETTADVVARKLGVETPCATRDTVLLPHTAFHRALVA